MIFVSTALVSGVEFPETKRLSKNEQAFRDEYKQFLHDFLFPLLGNDNVNLEEVYFTKTDKHSVIECIPFSVLEGYAATITSYSNHGNMYQG